jgi:rhodanese-related sulfurtransferase
MKLTKLFGMAALMAGLSVSNVLLADEAKPVGITADKMSVTVKHGGESVEIKRNQDNKAVVVDDFAKTSRPCPPFCIQPDTIADGVETIAEMGMLGYLEKMSEGDASVLVVDSRTADWVEKGTIPGAVNIPWEGLAPDKGASTDDIIKILTEQFGAKLAEGKDALAVDEAVAAGGDAVSKVFDYSSAKTLVMFCNGMWCGQSPTNIKTLLKFGYPTDKLKWYRGGMQDWAILGLTTVKPAVAK